VREEVQGRKADDREGLMSLTPRFPGWSTGHERGKPEETLTGSSSSSSSSSTSTSQ
jgi:hypothetical protein